jgi:hypothetical protein
MVFMMSVGPTTDEVTGHSKKMNNKVIKLVLFAKRYPGGQIKKNEMDGKCGTYERERGGAYRLMVGKPKENTIW